MIAEFYPNAWAGLELARSHKKNMAKLWNSALDAGLVSESVEVDASGTGQIVGYATWPDNTQNLLTASFKECVGALWASLDHLVAETASRLSVHRRLRNPERPRYFPVADSKSSFEALLAESALDGVLKVQYQMVRDCQPFQADSSFTEANRMRGAIRQLTRWENDLENGLVIEPWATPVAPEVETAEPAIVESLATEPPGLIREERLLATFEVRKFRPGLHVAGTSGTYVDLCFPHGFQPRDVDDTFESRLTAVIDAVQRFAQYFAHFTANVGGVRRVLAPVDPSEPLWTEASLSPRRWSDGELAKLAASGSGLAKVVTSDELILMVSTPNGVYERVVPNASPLRNLSRRGLAAEAAIHDAAATWGLPDFVLTPSVERKGAGVREISDGLLVVGDLGVVVQSKSREGEPGSQARERSWTNKQIAAGIRQIEGTTRRLQAGAIRMTNGRGSAVRVDGPNIEWIGVVIVDHPAPPQDFALDPIGAKVPYVVLLRRDWEFLFDQLRSTHAVVSYLQRVGEPTKILGEEPQRYFELAAADAAAPATPIDPTLHGVGSHSSVPLLPTAPAGADDDEAHGMFRIVLEDLATTNVDDEKLDDLQTVLSSLDTLPVGHRSELGRILIDALAGSAKTKTGAVSWRFRTYLAGPGAVQLGFGVCSTFDDSIKLAFQNWLILRHHERGERSGHTEGLNSIGVLLTPRHDGVRDWDTTMIAVRGDIGLSDEELTGIRKFWNKDSVD